MGIRIWRWLAPVLVVALGAGVGLAFGVAAVVRPAPLPVDRTPVPLAGHKPCAAVQMFFDAGTDGRDIDREMGRVDAALANDPKARRVYTQTQAESWAEFKRLFADHPDLIAQVKAADLPAVITVIPVPRTDLTDYAAELHRRFPAADKAQPYDVDSFAKTLPSNQRGPACPPAGER
ncbi:permease-like cell division protein FtsX [Amycolatopsis sp. NPDC051373]|uniref:permease-like cell division protein FtsX n=1 Tax=Amycolatopsis sp. NPDC051373 TaxID=3155801 RepID=UPI003450BC00